MGGMIERLPGWPTLPDLLGWMESGLPGTHGVPGLHGIRVEEYVMEGTYVLRAELPGIDPANDLEVSVAEGVLTLRAQRAESAESDDKASGRHRSEFHYGTFVRSVSLPAGASGDEATADYRNGVLTITVPVQEAKSGARTIPVRHG